MVFSHPLRMEGIVAIGEDGTIGNQGTLPWHIPEDLAHFKALTQGNIILMGRKTFASIGRPLPNRINVVLSRDVHNGHDHQVTWVNSVQNAQEKLKVLQEQHGCAIFVIGGSAIFDLWMPSITIFHITHVQGAFDGDARFAFNPEGWNIQQDVWKQKDGYTYAFHRYERPTI